MSDLADDLYQAYRGGRTTLRFPEPPTTGPPPLTTPDLFRHIAEAVPTGYSEYDLETATSLAYDDGRQWGDDNAWTEFRSDLRDFCRWHLGQQTDSEEILADLKLRFDL